jgi:putative membrane protein
MKTFLSLSVLGLALMLTGLPPPAHAATKADEARGQFSEKDYELANDLTRGAILEVKAGELARLKASDPSVKQFGEKMISDHGKASDELKALANKKGATLITDLDTDQQRVLNRLQNLTGPDFDKAYAEEMVEDHKKDLKVLKAAKVEDADLRAFATDSVAMVARHLAQAQAMSASVNKQ